MKGQQQQRLRWSHTSSQRPATSQGSIRGHHRSRGPRESCPWCTSAARARAPVATIVPPRARAPIATIACRMWSVSESLPHSFSLSCLCRGGAECDSVHSICHTNSIAFGQSRSFCHSPLSHALNQLQSHSICHPMSMQHSIVDLAQSVTQSQFHSMNLCRTQSITHTLLHSISLALFVVPLCCMHSVGTVSQLLRD